MSIAKDVIDHWKHDWKTNRLMFWFELIGTVLSIAGTTTLSVNIIDPPKLLCYTLWFLGSTLIMIGAHMRRASWMFLLMAFNTLLNIVGLTVLVLR